MSYMPKRRKDDESSSSSRQNKIVMDDVSEGKELQPIKAINNFNDLLPNTFNYVIRNESTKAVKETLLKADRTLPEKKGCNCEYDPVTKSCCGTKECDCEKISMICFNPKARIVTDPARYEFYEEFYVECGAHCACRGRCNRKILPGSPMLKKVHMEYFRDKGWGVVADQPIAIGQPIGEYRGLVFHKKLDADIAASHYQQDLVLDNKKNFYIIDAKESGNITRFINHSCSPNILPVVIYPSIPMRRKVPPLPRVAFIACSDILPNDELVFDYGYSYFADRKIVCRCYEWNCCFPPADWTRKSRSFKAFVDEIMHRKREMRQLYLQTEDIKDKIIELD